METKRPLKSFGRIEGYFPSWLHILEANSYHFYIHFLISTPNDQVGIRRTEKVFWWQGCCLYYIEIEFYFVSNQKLSHSLISKFFELLVLLCYEFTIVIYVAISLIFSSIKILSLVLEKMDWYILVEGYSGFSDWNFTWETHFISIDLLIVSF